MNYVSDRGFPLVCSIAGQYPILTVELYIKWYKLYLIQPIGRVSEVRFDEIESFLGREWEWAHDGSIQGDHVVNPKAVEQYAKQKGYTLDPLAYELLVGRWVIEHLGGLICSPSPNWLT